MRRPLVALLLVAVCGGLLAVSSTANTRAGAPVDAGFRLADGSAGCSFADGRLGCRSNSMRHAVVLAPGGSTSADDVPVSWDEGTTVLRATESWWHGDFSCRVLGRRVVCTTVAGGTLTVAARP